MDVRIKAHTWVLIIETHQHQWRTTLVFPLSEAIIFDINVIFSRQIFFVLRKKNSHISTLHVIHHGVMPMSVWFGVKFTPGGHSTFFGFINTFVHILMYTYYFFAALGPQYQKYLWWKKYLTAIQMVRLYLDNNSISNWCQFHFEHFFHQIKL